MSSVFSPSVSSSYMPADSYYRSDSPYSRPATSSYQSSSTPQPSTPPRLSRTLSLASRSSPEEEEEDEVESALFSDDYESSLAEDQILSQLHSNLLDPVMFPRTALSEITERTEQTRSVALTDSTEGYSDYAPSQTPSFLASSPEEPASPSVQASTRFGSRFDELSSSSSSVSSHSRGASEPTYYDIAPTSALRHARQASGASPVRRLAQFFEDKTSDGSVSSGSSGYRSLSTASGSPYTTSRSMPSFATPAQQSASSYARSTTMQSLSSPSMTSSITSRPSSSPTRSSVTPSQLSSGTARPGSPTKGSYTSAFSSRPSSPTKSAASSRSTESYSQLSGPSASSLTETPKTKSGPFSTVRNLVARFKDSSPSSSLTKSMALSSASSGSSPSLSSYSRNSEGLFSIKRRQESLRRAAAGRQSQPTPTSVYSEGRLFAPAKDGEHRSVSERSFASDVKEESASSVSDNGNGNGRKDNGSETSGSGSGSGGSSFDAQAEVASLVPAGKEPLRTGHLWYLNVHSGAPYTWVRARAVLYPTQLVLSWIAPGGGQGIVTLDLINCTEVRSVPSPVHPSAQNDIGSIAAREQSNQPGSDDLVELLCPFQLIYGDGVERLAAESARERVRWVGAIWDALSRATTLAAQSTRASSPPLSIRSTPSIRSLRSEQTEQSSRTSSTEGSRSTTFLPPRSEIPTIRSPSVSSESFTGSGSSVSGPRFRTSTLASASIFGPRTETQSVLSPRTESQSVRSATDSRSVVSSRSGADTRSVVSSRSGTETRSAVSSATRSTDIRSPATRTSAISGTPVTQSADLRSSSSVTESMSEDRTPITRTGSFRSPSAFSRSAVTFLSPSFTGTGSLTRSLDDSVLSSGADSFASEGRSIAPSRSSSLRRTTSMTDLDREFEPMSPRSESGSIYLSVGRISGAPVGTSTGAQIGRGPSLVFSPPPAPRRTRSKSPRGPRRPTTPSSYESSSRSASTSEIARTAPQTSVSRSPGTSYFPRSPATDVSSYTSDELTPTQESRSDTFTRLSSPRTRTQISSSSPPLSPTRSFVSTRLPSEDFEGTSEGSEGSGLRRAESGSDWTSSVDRSSARSPSLVSSMAFPSGRSYTETLSAPSESSSTPSSVSRELRRSPARRYGERTRTQSATERDRLTIPTTPTRQRTFSDTSDTTPTRTRRRSASPSGETTPRSVRSYGTASEVAPTLEGQYRFEFSESASSFAGSEVPGDEFTTASSSDRGSTSTERRSHYSTASQGRSMYSGASVSSEGDYRTASSATSFVTAGDVRTPSTTYRSLSTCPMHSDSFTTASDCDSGVTAECRCKRTPVPSPLPSASSLALSPLRSLTPTPLPTPAPVPIVLRDAPRARSIPSAPSISSGSSISSVSSPPSARSPSSVPSPSSASRSSSASTVSAPPPSLPSLHSVPISPYSSSPYMPSPPSVASAPSGPTVSSATSVSSIPSTATRSRVPSISSVPSVGVFHNPPPSPMPVSRPPPSPVPSSVRLPFQPVPSVRSLPSSLASPMSESTPTLHSVSRSPSMQSVDMPDVPAASEISRPPSVVPTIPSLTPTSSLSSRRTVPREFTPTVSSASWTESVETPEISDEFGVVRDVVPSPSLSFSEASLPTHRMAPESAPTPSRSVTTSWIPSSPSVVREVPPAATHPPASPTPSPWEPSESSVYTSAVSEEEEMSTIQSMSYLDAPAASLARAPSIRSIKSLWATETDVSFESSLLHPSPSMESVGLPQVITYETTPVRLTLPSPSVSSESMSLAPTPEVAPSPGLPMSPSVISTATTESTVELRDAPRTRSPAISPWDDASSVTPSVMTEYTMLSPSEVSSATRSISPDVARPLPSLPPSRRHSPAPSIASFRSYSTRVSNRPSIASRLSTVVSLSLPEEPEPEPEPVAPAPILTDDVNRLVQLINDMNQHRAGDTRDLASQVGRIEEELFDLSRFLRDDADQRRQRELEALATRPEPVIIQVPAPVEPEPEPVEPEPVVEPEPISTPEEIATSVSSPSASSTVSLSESSPSSLEELPMTARAIPVAKTKSPISVTPPPLHDEAPSTPTTTAETFLSSHYSEYEDLESEEPITEESESELIPDAPTESPSSLSLHNVPHPPKQKEPSSPSPSSSPTSASSPSSLSEPSSPASTTTSITVQARPPVSLAGLKDALNRLEKQHQDLLTGQRSLAQVLDDIRRRPIYEPPEAESDHGIPQGIQHIEHLLQQVLSQCRKIRSETSQASESEETGTLTDVDTVNSEIEEQLLRDHWKNLLQRHGMSQPATVPLPPRPPLPDLTIADIPYGEEPISRPGAKERPSQLPFEEPLPQLPERDSTETPRPRPAAPDTVFANYPAHRPKPARRRAQSQSPTIEYEPIPPSEPEDADLYGDTGRPYFPSSQRPSQRPGRQEPFVRPSVTGEDVDTVLGNQPVEGSPEIDFLKRLQDLRKRRRPGDGYFYPGGAPTTEVPIGPPRPPSAPPGRQQWYMPSQPTGVPIQPLGSTPSTRITVVPPPVSMPTGQTIVAPPQLDRPHLDVGDMREMLDLLRRNDRAQQIALDQQREVIRYLGDLNGWLERDAHDRQGDMTSLAARLDRLRDELAQRHVGQPPFVPPFMSPGGQPVTVLPTGHEGIPLGFGQQPPPFVPPGATATVHIGSPDAPIRFAPAYPGQPVILGPGETGPPPFVPPLGIAPPGSQVVVPGGGFVPPGAFDQPTPVILPGSTGGFPMTFPGPSHMTGPVLGPDGQPVIITAPTGQPFTVLPPGMPVGEPIPVILPAPTGPITMAPTGTMPPPFVPTLAQPTGTGPFIPTQPVLQHTGQPTVILQQPTGQPAMIVQQPTGQPPAVIQQPFGTGQPIPVMQPQGTGIPVTIIPPTPPGQVPQPITIIQPPGGTPGQGPITVIPPPVQQPGQFTGVLPEGVVPPVQSAILTGGTGRPATTILTTQPTGVPLTGLPTGGTFPGQLPGVMLPQPTGIPMTAQPTGALYPLPGQEYAMEPGMQQQPMIVRVGSQMPPSTAPAVVRVAPEEAYDRHRTSPQTVIHVHTTGQQQPQVPSIIRIASPRRASPDRMGAVAPQVIIQQPPPPSSATGTTEYLGQQPGTVVQAGQPPIIIQQPQQPMLQQPTGVLPQPSGQTIVIQQPPQQVPYLTGQPQPSTVVLPSHTGTSTSSGSTREHVVVTQPTQPGITIQPAQPGFTGASPQPIIITQPQLQPAPTGPLLQPTFGGPMQPAVTGETMYTVQPQPTGPSIQIQPGYQPGVIQPGYTGTIPFQPGFTGVQPIQLQPGYPGVQVLPTGQTVQLQPQPVLLPGQTGYPVQPVITGQPVLAPGPQPGQFVVVSPPPHPVGIQPVIAGQVPQQVLLPGQVLAQPTQIVPPTITGATTQIIPPPPQVVHPPITVVQPPMEAIQPVNVVPGPQLVPQPTFIPSTQTPGVILTHPSGATGQSVLVGPGGPIPSIVLAPQPGIQPLHTGQGPIYVAQPQPPLMAGQPPIVVGPTGAPPPVVLGQPPAQPVVIGQQPVPIAGVPTGQPVFVQQPGQAYGPPYIVQPPQPGQPITVPTGMPIMIPLQPGQTGQPPIMIQPPGEGVPIALHPGQQYIIGQPGLPFVQQLPAQTVVQSHPTGVEVPAHGTIYVQSPFIPQVTGVETQYTGAPTVLPHFTGAAQTVLPHPTGHIPRVHTGVPAGYPSGVQTAYTGDVHSVYPSGQSFVSQPGYEHVPTERPHRPESAHGQTIIQLPPQQMPHVIRITSPHRASPRVQSPQAITVVQEPPRQASPIRERIIERIVEKVGTPTIVRIIGREAEPARAEAPSVVRIAGPPPTPLQQPVLPSIPEIVRIAGLPPRRTPSPTVIHLEPGQTAPALPPSVIRVGTSQSQVARVEEPPTRITVEVPPATPHPPMGTPAIVRIAGVPQPPAQPLVIPRIPTPPPTTVRVEYATPPEPTPQPAPQVIRITAPLPPPQPVPVHVPAVPITVTTPGPMPAVIRIDASALRRPATTVSIAQTGQTGQTEIVVVEPSVGTVSEVGTEGPSEHVEPPIDVEVIPFPEPAETGPSRLSSIIEEAPPSVQGGSVSSFHGEEEAPVVEQPLPPLPPRTAPPTVITLHGGAPSRAELPPAVVRVGTSFGTRPVSPTFVRLPPSQPATPAIVRIQGVPAAVSPVQIQAATPAIVRIQGAPATVVPPVQAATPAIVRIQGAPTTVAPPVQVQTATPAIVRIHGVPVAVPPPVPTAVPSVIRITSPQVGRPTPIVVARAPPTVIVGATPGVVDVRVDEPPRVALISSVGTHPGTVISFGTDLPIVEEPSSPETRPPQTVISAPDSTHTVPPPVVYASPSSVATPVPRRSVYSTSSDLDRLQEQARLQDEQQRILAEQAEQRRREMIELAERREMERQQLFELREAERQRAFEESELERQAAAEARREELFRLAEERRAQIAAATERVRTDAEVSVRDSVISATDAIQEVIERSEKERERITEQWKGALEESQMGKVTAEEHAQRLGSEIEMERSQRFFEQQERIRHLEEELERQRLECAEEKRRFEEVETERYEFRRNWDQERDEVVQQQLGDISNRLQDRTMEAQRWRELDEQRIQEAEIRRTEKTERMQELHDLVHSIIADREEEKRRAEEERAAAAAKPSIENIYEAIIQQNAQQQAFMARAVEDMRADAERQHQEILETVQATAHERIDFNLSRYMDDFSKALASE
ncbi:hypothetical protein FRB90_006205, partial [Tulasnella sp. 427]